MGVRGLTTFLNDNRYSLCQTVTLNLDNTSSRPSSSAVVDAWGLIFHLYLNNLPWAAGGEYLGVYRLTKYLIQSWRRVGLEPLFVFDGVAPMGKHDTMINRMEARLSSARLFYSLSPSTRSKVNNNDTEFILPPFAFHAFNHALESLNVARHFVPEGEADAMCVVLADRMGGYVIGRDSDFLILARGSENLKGYVPLDFLQWIDNSPLYHSTKNEDGFKSVTRGKTSSHINSLIPIGFHQPSLVLTVIPPQMLCQRLRLPASLLPLFASLCGNDYTSPLVLKHLDDYTLHHTKRIERVARIIRETYFSKDLLESRQAGNAADRGDRMVEFVNRTVKKMTIRPFDCPGQQEVVVDSVLDATVHYILPTEDQCCLAYPLCDGTKCRGRAAAKEAYAEARRKGLLAGVSHAFLQPDRIYLQPILEDPTLVSLRGSNTLLDIRIKSYEIASQGLGGFRFPSAPSSQIETPTQDLEKEDQALIRLLQPDSVSIDTSLNPETPSTSSSSTFTPSSSSVITFHTDTQPKDQLQESTNTIVEYLRSSNRIVTYSFSLSSLPTSPLQCLQPLSHRLQTYLTILQSYTPLILSLPVSLHPLVAGLRIVLRLAAERGRPETKWRAHELRSVLRASLGTWSIWLDIHVQESITRREEEERHMPGALPLSSSSSQLEYMSYTPIGPLLSNRNCQLIAQYQTTMLEMYLLAQSLLILPPSPSSLGDLGDRSELMDEMERQPTHLIPFVFINGEVLHWVGKMKELESGVWKWGEKEKEWEKKCWEAIIDGMEDYIVGLSSETPLSDTFPDHSKEHEADMSRKNNRKKKKGGEQKVDLGKNQVGENGMKGRFDILSTMGMGETSSF
ncbi:hypothetical protein TREMEDRAFT_27432 [Tremella mesenterica DSM 1558]|uniref:uncharacterized protein n=1 Tax=Tremella mesenterica (strain ATCC 24925 / CBS 8224 / DSM 1558 / NBRC 9311 / NRRL Y-6157 / RJB 2259-6 / UBC 559-6) TaxID=578456 RepID=UPI0003F4A096|nr:uncharacterized protein TREMEDRAFT_27432 [Tremella mesenterica DSM 1558]EIW71127.1 hypothetical protein TREMEDRAFT_27432 [Tremella mesenterica DSM 1558]